MTRFLQVMAALAAAIIVLAGLSLPPASIRLAIGADGSVPGIIHVHTNRSDGLGTPDEVAAAAARAGLRFVILSDHGDGTRTPDPPTYRSGVLCLDGVEISTTGGHYVAFDLPAAPYPLGGDPRDVVEDVKRLGGFGIAAHPDSPKPELAWRDWSAPFDGVELVNLDTGWRALAAAPGLAPKWELARALLTYPIRPAETMAAMVPPSAALPQWIALAARRRVVVSAGADAHARLALRSGDPQTTRLALPVPSYESSFRVISIHAQIQGGLSGRAPEDAEAIVRALRAGHSYIAMDALASPPAFEFTATNTHGTVNEGDELGAGGPVLLHVRSNAPSEFTTIVYSGPRALTSVHDTQDLSIHAGEGPAVYWVEIRSPDPLGAQTWIRSNPIYVRNAVAADGPPPVPPPAASLDLLSPGTTTGWQVEKDPASSATLETAPDPKGAEILLGYRLGSTGGTHPFAGLVVGTPSGTAMFERMTFTARADHPMRISVQLRTDRDRWQRSVFVDTFEQVRTVRFEELRPPIGSTHTSTPHLDEVRSIMFVVETTNTKPGTSGRVWIGRPVLER